MTPSGVFRFAGKEDTGALPFLPIIPKNAQDGNA
jgi:hypothetical protein